MAKGSVTLVGAGCGRDLITVKGLSVIREADVIIYDDLLDNHLLMEAKPGAEKLYVGKRRGQHSEEQIDINSLLVKKAKEGKKVVRLKGGDSFVFGRGGEEILTLQEADIPYELIPGVTSSVAVPGHSGIPVTHRGVAQSVTIITGHTATGKNENYAALAQLDGTLVFLMGLKNVGEITAKLLKNGKSPDTPAAIISEGFTAREKRINGTLGDITEKSLNAVTPAILVVGETAAFHMERTLRGPLDSVSINLIGTDLFIQKLDRELAKLGADTTLFPCLKVEPVTDSYPEGFGELRKKGDSEDNYDWILFTSSNGVECAFNYLFSKNADIRAFGRVKFACIGEGTADSLKKHGIIADFEPSEYTARALGAELPGVMKPNEKALILRAENGSEALTEELDKAGIVYRDTVVYRTIPDLDILSQSVPKADYTVFASARGVHTFLKAHSIDEHTVPVCIGPSTKAAYLSEAPGYCLVAEQYSVKGIVETILKHSQPL